MKNAILTLLASVISITGANAIAPIIFGADLEPGDEATAIAIWIFVALWFMYRVGRTHIWQKIAAPAKTWGGHKSSEPKARPVYQDKLERRGAAW